MLRYTTSSASLNYFSYKKIIIHKMVQLSAKFRFGMLFQNRTKRLVQNWNKSSFRMFTTKVGFLEQIYLFGCFRNYTKLSEIPTLLPGFNICMYILTKHVSENQYVWKLNRYRASEIHSTVNAQNTERVKIWMLRSSVF